MSVGSLFLIGETRAFLTSPEYQADNQQVRHAMDCVQPILPITYKDSL